MSDKKNVPKIRFPGFTEPWEQRKLSGCAGFRRGSFPQPYGNKDWYDGEGAMPFVQVADVSSDMRLVKDTKQKISKLAQPMSVFAEKGSVLVTLQGSIGRVAITQYGAFVDRTVLIFDKYKDDIDKRFWAYIIKEKFEDEARKAPGGTIKTITKEVLSDFNLMLPCYDEQSKVADYLINLDRLITLHQRKLEHVKKMKKSMLQKMFPKKNQLYPEVRFPGFTDAWEQRKLGEIATFINGRAYSQDELLNSGKYKVLRVGNFYTNDSWYYSDMELDDKYYAENGDLLYTWSATFGPHIWHGNKVIYHYHIWKIELSKALEKNFALQLLERDKQAILSDKNGSTMVHITKAGMERKEVLLPTNIVEQVKIGEYFTNLDHLITLHQRELDHLQLLKKGMLQQMFI